MPDTKRPILELLELFKSGEIKNVSAQDCRDLLVSVFADIDFGGINHLTAENIKDAFDKKHIHDNKTILDAIQEALTTTLKTAYDQAVTDSHTHTNQAILDAIEESLTTALKTAYDQAVTDSHTHTNQAILDAIQEALTTALKNAYDDAVTKKHTQGTDTTLGTQTQNLNMGTHKIVGVVDPTTDQEAATKKYVDFKGTTSPELEPIWTSEALAGGNPVDAIRNMIVENGYLYVANNNGPFYVFDVHDPNSPHLISTLQTNKKCCNNLKLGDYCFISTRENHSILVIDVSNPKNPTIVEEFIDTTRLSDAHGLFLDPIKKLLYAINAGGGGAHGYFCIIDISNPLSLTLTGSLQSTTSFSQGHDIVVDGKYAYVTAYRTAGGCTDSPTIIDVSDPANPSIVASLTMYQGESYILKRGRYLFTGSHEPAVGLTSYNVEDPTNPIRLQTIKEDQISFAYWMNWYSYKYIIAITNKFNVDHSLISIIDVSCPTDMIIVNEYTITDYKYTKHIVIDGKYAYISYANLTESRIRIYKITHGFQANPSEIALYEQLKSI